MKKLDMKRRQLVAALAACCAFATPMAALAQDYPTETITIIAPTGPGSLVDILARLVGDGMTQQWGQQVVVKNVAGAGGSIGATQIAGAEADGYTLGFVPANLTTLPYLYDITYDVKADFAPIVRVAGASMVHYVNKDLGINSEAEFLEYAKAHPGELTFATAGTGSAANLAAELMMARTGIEMIPVPYDKLNLGVLDVVAGRVSTVFVSAAQGMPFVNDGKLLAIGVTGKTANPAAPDVLPIAEQGLEGYEFNSWFGFVAPAGTPDNIIAAIHDEVVRQSQTPAFQEALERAGLVPLLDDSAAFSAAIDAELADWAKILKK